MLKFSEKMQKQWDRVYKPVDAGGADGVVNFEPDQKGVGDDGQEAAHGADGYGLPNGYHGAAR